MPEAGFPLLKEYGMTHTTISKLTEKAGIAKVTFYHFWKDILTDNNALHDEVMNSKTYKV